MCQTGAVHLIVCAGEDSKKGKADPFLNALGEIKSGGQIVTLARQIIDTTFGTTSEVAADGDVAAAAPQVAAAAASSANAAAVTTARPTTVATKKKRAANLSGAAVASAKTW